MSKSKPCFWPIWLHNAGTEPRLDGHTYTRTAVDAASWISHPSNVLYRESLKRIRTTIAPVRYLCRTPSPQTLDHVPLYVLVPCLEGVWASGDRPCIRGAPHLWGIMAAYLPYAVYILSMAVLSHRICGFLQLPTGGRMVGSPCGSEGYVRIIPHGRFCKVAWRPERRPLSVPSFRPSAKSANRLPVRPGSAACCGTTARRSVNPHPCRGHPYLEPGTFTRMSSGRCASWKKQGHCLPQSDCLSQNRSQHGRPGAPGVFLSACPAGHHLRFQNQGRIPLMIRCPVPLHGSRSLAPPRRVDRLPPKKVRGRSKLLTVAPSAMRPWQSGNRF